MEIAFMSPGVLTDAGGFIIYIGSDGKLHVKKVPPMGPETVAELTAVFSILEGAGQLRNQKVQQELLHVAQAIAAPHAGELQKAVGAAG